MSQMSQFLLQIYPFRGQIAPIFGKTRGPWGQSKSHKNTRRRLHYALPDLTKLDKITNHHKCLCKSSQEQLPNKRYCMHLCKKCRTGQHSRFLQLTFLGTNTNHRWRPILDLSSLHIFLKIEKFKMETPKKK